MSKSQRDKGKRGEQEVARYYRGLGFDVPAAADSAAGQRIGKGPLGAFGHLGFTGASLWVDRDRQLSVALLTNRWRTKFAAGSWDL